MIAIENFPAETWVDVGDAGKTERVFCQVVGVVKEDDAFEFVVMIENAGERWVELRDHVTARDGRSCWPD